MAVQQFELTLVFRWWLRIMLWSLWPWRALARIAGEARTLRVAKWAVAHGLVAKVAP
ncbi:MAG: hypothetical protein HY323_07310 [Betaproteobacteria bacterium]|nr:hypothetical protein [Betaproteobacteria bacterium]